MNAVNPVASSPAIPAPDAGAAEPSMEEILASIRRIIADDSAPRLPLVSDREADHAGPSLPPPHDTHASSPHEDAHSHSADAAPAGDPPVDLLPADGQLREEQAIPGLEAVDEPSEPPAHAAPEAVLPSPSADIAGEPMTELPPHPLAPPQMAPAQASDDLALESELERLRSDPLPDVSPVPPPVDGMVSAAAESAVTTAFNTLAASRFVDNSDQLTRLVAEMIRPLVKAWVDEHLPGMVERLVVAEIERMARR